MFSRVQTRQIVPRRRTLCSANITTWLATRQKLKVKFKGFFKKIETVVGKGGSFQVLNELYFLKIVIKGRKPLSLTLLANTGIFISGVNPKLKLSCVVICNGIRKNCERKK